MSIASEFKEFAMKGNVVDMAVGVIIGTAFGKIVSSLVGDVIMPPLGKALSGVNFSESGGHHRHQSGRYADPAEVRCLPADAL